MDDPKKVRNVTVLGTMGHGKSCMMDNLGAMTGYLSENKIGDQLFTLYRADEKEKKSNYKCNPCHMVVETKYNELKGDEGKQTIGDEKKDKFMFCMCDTPGHLDYSPEVAASLRMTDGTLCTVGVQDGVGVMMEYMIADSLKERCKPTLFVNKLDISIIVLQKPAEELYQDISRAVQNMNVALAGAEKLGLKGFNIDPLLGNVVFGSAYYGWAFSLRQFAKIYASKMGIEEDKMLGRLWGDQFFNAKKKTWTKVEVEGGVRGFCQFILDPIIKLHKLVLEKGDYETMLTKLGVTLKAEDKKLEGKALLKRIMTTWLPASEAISEMVATHLPDPVTAQKKKMEHIYKGEADSDICKAMIACDPAGPVMINIVKMTPTGSAGRFFGVGRIFSGTVGTDKYHVRAPDFDPEDPETAAFTQDGRVQSLNLNLGKDILPIMNAPAGNIVSLGGIDQFMNKSATVTNKKEAFNFLNLSFNVSCVYRIAIRPADNKQLPKLVEGLKRLQKADILCTCVSEPTGDHIVSGCGEEHLKLVLRDLKEEHAGVDFTRGVPTVSYKETVTCESSKMSLSKSPNKHNRLYVLACPLEEDVNQAIETHKVNMQQDVKKRARILIDEYGWEKTDCMKIWSFAPNDIDVGGANVLVDQTKGIQYLNEIKESVNSGLQWAARQGPLAEENMRGCRFNLMDVKLHADSIHRGMGQIQPTARRVFFGAALVADVRFMEPIFKCVIACPEDVTQGVQQAIMAKRGEMQYSEEKDGKTIMVCFLPIVETLGDDPFSKVLQTKTSGKALATYAFDHWQLIQTNPLEKGSKAEQIMLDIRERKGLKVEHPDIADYIDRL
jgi:elongation factor 2